jgi:hypothetical protein
MVAFAIGVGGPERLPYLPGAINGARQFQEWALALGYQTHLVIDDQKPVTLDRLKNEFLAELQITDSPISRFVIYFAGHGLIREAEEGLWLLSDWNSQLRAVGVEVLKRRLYQFNIGQIAIFSDSCRSLPPDIDAADLTLDPVLGKGPYAKNDPPIDKFIAAQDGFTTFMVPGDTPDEDRCLFSGVLMEGLWGFSQEAFSQILSTKVTSSSLGAFLKKEVPKRAAQYNRVLSPSVSPTFPNGEDIYYDQEVTIVRPSFRQWPTIHPSFLDSDAGIAAPVRNLPEFKCRSSVRGVPDFMADVRSNFKRGKIEPETTAVDAELELRGKRTNAGASLLGKIQSQSRPDGFETECGFAVEGAVVRNLWTRADVLAKPHHKANWWRIGNQSGDPLLRSAPVLIEFENNTFLAVTALPHFIATVLNVERGVAALIYRHIYAPSETAAAAEKAVAQLESGTLRADDTTDLATQIRRWKLADPILGVISAYLYDSINDIESIRRMAYYYAINNQPIPYDIALLGLLQSKMRDDGLLSVVVPAVAERDPRTPVEEEHYWTYSATTEVTGEVGGFWPWMRQGWAFLDDYADDGSGLVAPGLVELISSLTAARFASLDAEGGERLAKLFALSPGRQQGTSERS